MAWIESHQSLGTHLKLRRLARELRVHRAQAIGHLHFLWWWALDNAPTGDLSGLTNLEIAEVAEWPGDENAFVASLKACGWIEESGQIHDWEDYAGRIVVTRAKDRERKRAERNREINGASRDSGGMSGGCPTDVQRTSNGRPTDVHRPSREKKPESMHTQPNPTQPDVEPPQRARVDPDPPDVEPPPFFPRTQEEAAEACGIVGCPAEFAVEEWHRAMSRGGRDARDVPIRSWSSYLRICWTRLQGREAEKKARAPKGEGREIQEVIKVRRVI